MKTIALTIDRHPANLLTVGLITGYIAASVFFVLKHYLQMDASFLVGVVLFPYLIILRKKGVYSSRYGFAAFVFLALSVMAPVKTLLYFTLAFGFLFLLESRVGKLNILPLLLLLVISPIFRYATEVFTFPIRLQLSQWTGKLISLIYQQVEVQGNLILLQGNEFTVDKACVGLQLLTFSSLLTLFFLAYYERATRRRISTLLTLLILGIMFGLVVFSNLIRMIILVLFNILPDNDLHYWTGIVCVVVYVIMPIAFLIRWFFLRWGKTWHDEGREQAPRPIWSLLAPALLLIIVLILPFLRTDFSPQLRPAYSSLPGYQQSVLHG